MLTDTACQETRDKFKEHPLWKPWMENIRLRQAGSITEVREFLESGEGRPRLSWDIETVTLIPKPEEVVGHSIAFDGSEAMYIPVRHAINPEQNLDPKEVEKLLLPVIEEKIVLVYNWLFEGLYLRLLGIKRPSGMKLEDCFLYVWLYDCNSKKLGLKDNSKKLLNMEMNEIGDVPGAKRDKKKRGVIDFSQTDPAEACLYAAADVIMPIRLMEIIQPLVDSPVELGGQKFVCQLEHKLLDSLFKMQNFPIMIDRAVLKQGREELTRWINVVASKLYALAGNDFNIGSPKEAADFLEQRGVKLQLLKSGKRSTSAKEIEKLAGEHPEVDMILLYRSLVKERSSYIDTLYEYTTEDSPYARFKIRSAGAPTGRFASGGVDPGEEEFYAPVNAQSIPSADSFKKGPVWLVENPPTLELDAAVIASVAKVDIEGEDEEDDDA